MLAEETNTRAWQIYGQRQLARGYTHPSPTGSAGRPGTGSVRVQKPLATSPAAASWTSDPEPATTPSISPRLTGPASPASSCPRPSTSVP